MRIMNLRFNLDFKTWFIQEKLKLTLKMIKKYHFHNFYCFSLQNLTPVENQLHRKIERLSLYRTIYATYSVNFNFAFKKLPTFFLVSFVLVPVTHMLIGENSIEICFLIEF